MNEPFSITATDIGTDVCQLTGRKAACVRVEVSSPLNLPPKTIDRRRLSEFFTKAHGAAELFTISSDAATQQSSSSSDEAHATTLTHSEHKHRGVTKSETHGRSQSTAPTHAQTET